MTRAAQSAGMDAAAAYIRKHNQLETWLDTPDLPLAAATNRPSLFRRAAVRRKLLPVLAELPQEFFRVITEERHVSFYVTPYGSGLSSGTPDTLGMEHGSSAVAVRELGAGLDGPIVGWVVELGRIAIELLEPDQFAGVVVHELCHVHLCHDFTASDLSYKEWRRVEDEAIALACSLGFRDETTAYLDAIHELLGDQVQTGCLPG